MKIEFRQVRLDTEVKAIASLARTIWESHFTPIIGKAQVSYMLKKFQSANAIGAQLQNGYEYYLTVQDGELVGYLGLVPDIQNKRMMLSKLYSALSVRGQGVGRAMLEYAESRTRELELCTIWLTVNKNNEGPVAWYQRRGFIIADAVKTDIGGGFFMDDFIMEKPVGLDGDN